MRTLARTDGLERAPSVPPGSMVGPVGPRAGASNYRMGGRNATDPSSVPPSRYDSSWPMVQTLIQDVSQNRNWFTPNQPIVPFGPPYSSYPREWDYPVGYNLDFATQKMVVQRRLRTMSRTWGVLRSIIQTRKDQFMRLPYEFRLRDKPSSKNKYTEKMREFFRRPDGKHS